MCTQELKIGTIPAVLYGEPAPNIWLFVHGQGGNKTEAAAFAALAAPTGWQVLGIDLPEHGDRTGETDFTPWQVVPELQTVLAYLQQHWQGIRLRANSIGAYFTMLALGDQAPDRALFVSPVLDMERLILDMMAWAGVSEQALCERGEVPTDFGETLSWAYLCYVREHPIAWQVPTEILYAGATIWCPVRVWSSSRRSTAPVSPSWRAVSTGSTHRSSLRPSTAGSRMCWSK